MKMKEKIGDLKDKFDRLNIALIDFKSDKVEHDNSSKDIAKEIKTHFLDCHSQLQTLEHDLYQKLEREMLLDLLRLVVWSNLLRRRSMKFPIS